MKSINFLHILYCAGIFLAMGFRANAQNAGLSLSWNGTAYVVKMEVVSGATPLFLGSSQITIVTPAAMSTAGIAVTCGSPCSPNQWVANTFVNAPAAAPGSNFVAIATLGGNMGAVAGGSSITLFTFTLPGGCNSAVRLFSNATDPNSSQMPGGQDFKNNLVNGLVNFEFYNGSNNNNVVCTPAPLDLLVFNVNREANNARLDWQTENEMEMSHFSIQRSVDGVRFEPIARIVATNQPTARYNYLDERVPSAALVYYRLEQFDADSTSDFSPVRSVRFPQNPLRLSVAPNPATREVSLTVSSRMERTVSVQVVDATGSVLYSARHALVQGANLMTISVADWPSGTYIVTVLEGTERVEQRLVVQH
jgi:hypothetical protein